MEMLRTVRERVKRNKRDLFLIGLWTIALALIIIRTHQQFYIDHPEIAARGVGFLSYAGPTFSEVELAIVLLVSALVSFFLVSVRSVIYGYFAAIVFSCSAATVYIYLYNWYVLELANVFAELAYGWEWVLFMAIINIFRYVFPIGITFSLIGTVLGTVARTLLNR
jgi:hypothetical protein